MIIHFYLAYLSGLLRSPNYCLPFFFSRSSSTGNGNLIKYRQTSEEEISKEEWNIHAFLAVLIMPITWFFSISPLFTNVLLLLQDKRWIVRGLAIFAFIQPMLVPPWGTQSTIGLFGFFIFAGIALVLSQSSNTWFRQLSNVSSD